MADSATVGDLLVRIDGKIDGLLDAAKRGGKALEDMNASGSRAQAGIQASTVLISAAVAFMSKAIINAVQSSIDRLVELGKTSQQIGLPVEQLSRLEFAAKKAGVSADELTQGIKLFARQAGEVRSAIEAPDDFARALSNLRVQLGDTNQKVRPTVDLILDLADRFSRMPDGVQKTSLAMQLFGRSGADMIPFLNQGREALAAFMVQSDAFGATVDKGSTESALRLTNAMKSLSDTFDRIFRTVAREYVPQIEELVSWLNNMVKASDASKSSMEGLKVVFDTIIGVGKLVVAEVINAVNALGLLIKAGKEIASGEFAKAWETLKSTVADTSGYFTATVDAVDRVGFASRRVREGMAELASGAKTSGDATKEAFKPVEQTAAQAAEAHKKAREEFQESLVVRADTAALDRLKVALDQGKMSWAEYKASASGVLAGILSEPAATESDKIAALTVAAQNEVIKMSQFQTEVLKVQRDAQLAIMEDVLNQDTATAEEKLDELKRAVDLGAVSAIRAGQIKDQVEKQYQQSLMDTAQVASTAITTTWKNNKAASISAAVINTAVGVTRAFRDVPWPLNWVQAGLIAATGAAQVASISSTNENGSGGGGSSAAAPAAAAQQAAPAAPSQSMIVSGFSAKEFIRGDVVEGIAKALVQYQRDGGQVVFQAA